MWTGENASCPEEELFVCARLPSEVQSNGEKQTQGQPEANNKNRTGCQGQFLQVVKD